MNLPVDSDNLQSNSTCSAAFAGGNKLCLLAKINNDVLHFKVSIPPCREPARASFYPNVLSLHLSFWIFASSVFCSVQHNTHWNLIIEIKSYYKWEKLKKTTVFETTAVGNKEGMRCEAKKSRAWSAETDRAVYLGLFLWEREEMQCGEFMCWKEI